MASTTRESDGEHILPAFHNPSARVSHGLPFPDTCAKHVSTTFQASRIYIIASGSLCRNTDYVKQLQFALAGKVVGVREGMKPHTLWSEVLEITAEARKADADLLITLGAGSLTDAAKVVATALANNVSTHEGLESLTAPHVSSAKLAEPTVKIISIPTSLSGGEFSNHAGATNDTEHRKHSFGAPGRGPALVILDPQLTITTPDSVWLSTGIRAVDHCTEGMCALNSTPGSDADAAKGLRLLIPGLLRCKANPQDLEARLSCQLGVIEAMKVAVVHGVHMGASHGIGHQLGPLGVGHGETSCILLPAVCRYNASVNGEQQRKVLEVLWSQGTIRALLEEKGLVEGKAELAEILEAVVQALGLPQTLKDVSVGSEKLESLAEASLKDRCLPTNPRPLKEKKQVMEILERVVG